MSSYVIGTWTESNGGIGEAQSDKGSSAIESYAGVYIGSGKMILSMTSISEREFENNKKRGVTTV